MQAERYLISEEFRQELNARILGDIEQWERLRRRAREGEFVPWISARPERDDYPIEVSRNGDTPTTVMEEPHRSWNVCGVSWRKAPDPTTTVHGEGG